MFESLRWHSFFHGAISENPYFGIDWEKLASTPAFSSESTARV